MIDWLSALPGGLLTGAGSSLLVWWRKSAVFERETELRFATLSHAMDLKFETRDKVLEQRMRNLDTISDLINDRHEEMGKTLREGLKDLKDEMKASTAEFRVAAMATVKATSEQTVINQFTNEAIRSLTRKYEEHDEAIDEIKNLIRKAG